MPPRTSRTLERHALACPLQVAGAPRVPALTLRSLSLIQPKPFRLGLICACLLAPAAEPCLDVDARAFGAQRVAPRERPDMNIERAHLWLRQFRKRIWRI